MKSEYIRCEIQIEYKWSLRRNTWLWECCYLLPLETFEICSQRNLVKGNLVLNMSSTIFKLPYPQESDMTEQLNTHALIFLGFPGGTSSKESVCQYSRFKRFGFDPWVGKIPLRKKMATHSSILAWKIPWTRGVWRATVHGATRSWTQLNWLSTHTHICL